MRLHPTHEAPCVHGDHSPGAGALQSAQQRVPLHPAWGQGQGSCFAVELPGLKCIEEAAMRTADSRALHFRRLRILIADDSVDLAENFAELLRGSGHAVEVVHDGEAALRLALAEVPDIALLDIGMPKCDGFEVARQLREAQTTSDRLLVAISGWGSDEDKVHARMADFDHYLIKPVAPAELVKMLAEAFDEFASARPGELP